MSVTDDAPVGEAHAADAEHRTWISLAARLEVATEPFELQRDLVQRELQIHPLLGTEVLRVQALPRYLAETLAELIQPAATDGEPGSHMVAAVALEQIAAGEKGSMQI